MIWIKRWSQELDAFTAINTMISDGKNLFQIYEFLRAAHPDTLRLHHAYIEKLYFEGIETIEGKTQESQESP